MKSEGLLRKLFIGKPAPIKRWELPLIMIGAAILIGTLEFGPKIYVSRKLDANHDGVTSQQEWERGYMSVGATYQFPHNNKAIKKMFFKYMTDRNYDPGKPITR